MIALACRRLVQTQFQRDLRLHNWLRFYHAMNVIWRTGCRWDGCRKSPPFRRPTPRMPHRQFKDQKQVNWEVWDVHPGEVERRLRTEREPARSQRAANDAPRAAVARDLA